MNELTREIEEYLYRSGMTATAFGRAVMKDPSFVFRMRNGRDQRQSTADKVREFIKAN
jgi:2,4-dienoyl-CoA reductase-like NADH-dependent reductase (Old Yellow Enzyme family)